MQALFVASGAAIRPGMVLDVVSNLQTASTIALDTGITTAGGKAVTNRSDLAFSLIENGRISSRALSEVYGSSRETLSGGVHFVRSLIQRAQLVLLSSISGARRALGPLRMWVIDGQDVGRGVWAQMIRLQHHNRSASVVKKPKNFLLSPFAASILTELREVMVPGRCNQTCMPGSASVRAERRSV
jgi:hypothetical protein